jgi:hypothetical protein
VAGYSCSHTNVVQLLLDHRAAHANVRSDMYFEKRAYDWLGESLHDSEDESSSSSAEGEIRMQTTV